MPERPQRIVPFSAVIEALLDESKLFPPTYLHRFSDISRLDLEELRKIWLQVNPARRIAMLEDLEDLAESDTLVSFDDLAIFALNDPEAGVRATAIRLLWEDQDPKLVPVFITMLENDPDMMVRAAAATALGLFVYLGELEEIPAETLHNVEDSLLGVISSSEDPIVRRRALESLGYSSRDEVPALIQLGYDTTDSEWLSSALFAMGRSADPRWEAEVLPMLDHHDARVQAEAVRAAGQLELATARQPLLDLLGSSQDLDIDVLAAAIWSLSQIGGESVRETLEALLDATEDDDEAEYLEQALENLSFTEDFGVFDLLDMDTVQDELSMKEIDSLDQTDPDEDDNKPGGSNQTSLN